MNKNNNNNYSRAPGTEPTMRFNKRSRYTTNTNGGNNSPRYKYQNQTAYQYTPNRSCAADNFQHNQYENNANRYFYNNSSKRSNYSHQQSNKQSTNCAHKSIPSSPSTFSASTQKVNLSPQSDKLPAKAASATVTTQNNQQQLFTPNIMEPTNYYGYPYNFYPNTYNTDLIPTASSSGFGDGMIPFLWQTITSTPPPKLPQQQPPLPLQQPPVLPPLPSPERPHLPPPPPIPASIIDSASPTVAADYIDRNISNCQDSGAKTIVKMKAKRKAMSVRYKLSKLWSESDAILALKAEEANAKKLQKDFILVIRFPDPEISREIVKNYSPDIESVHFQLNFAPRYCLIHLKPGTDVEKTIDHLSKIPFGTGYLSVEIKQNLHKAHSTKLNEIDPFTLYVGNLPITIACKTLKEHFPGAARIDIGHAQRMKYTRYAFIRYQNVHLAIEAYKRMLDAEIGGRTLTIRFRRLTTASEGNKEPDAENNNDLADDLIGQTAVDESESPVNEVAQTDDDDVGISARSADKNQADDGLENGVSDSGNNKETDTPPEEDNICMEENLTKTNESTSSPLNTNRGDETISHNNSNSPLFNIKPDPDADPNDVVVRHNTIANRSENDSSIKQEQESLALYEEFFERPQTQRDTSERSNISDRTSLTSTTDDTDTMSQLSSNSLREFLQICQRSKNQLNSNIKDAEPPMKRNKISIKREPLEVDNHANNKNLTLSSKNNNRIACVKQEAEESCVNLNTSVESICTINSDTDPCSRKKASNPNTSEVSHNSTTNSDDVVPPTALFFTRDYHSKWTNSNNNCDNEEFYDEFYETRANSRSSISQAKFKTEPLEISISSSTKVRNKKSQQEKAPNQGSSVCKKNICVENPSRNLTTISNAVDDDDLVPAQNLLGSYRSKTNVVKEEKEYDDLFSVPFSKSSESNTDFSESTLTNSISEIRECANMTEVATSHLVENDEDVVVVSANIPPAPKERKSDTSAYSNLIIPRLTDLVSFNYKPITVSIPNRDVLHSPLLIRGHLDELYDQLDADSDSEL